MSFDTKVLLRKNDENFFGIGGIRSSESSLVMIDTTLPLQSRQTIKQKGSMLKFSRH